MQMIRTVKRNNIVYPELSYKINGILFKARKELNRFCNEKQFCDKIEQLLKQAGLRYEREKILPPSFEGEHAARNKVDFLIEGKIILEIKAKPFVTKEDYYQTQRYLKAINVKLAILVNMRGEYIHPKRILNSKSAE